MCNVDVDVDVVLCVGVGLLLFMNTKQHVEGERCVGWMRWMGVLSAE